MFEQDQWYDWWDITIVTVTDSHFFLHGPYGYFPWKQDGHGIADKNFGNIYYVYNETITLWIMLFHEILVSSWEEKIRIDLDNGLVSTMILTNDEPSHSASCMVHLVEFFYPTSAAIYLDKFGVQQSNKTQ